MPEKKERVGLVGVTKYTFEEQNNDQRQQKVVEVCTQWLNDNNLNAINVSSDPAYFKRDVDIVYKKNNERIEADVKTDFIMNKSGNIVFELIERWPKNRKQSNQRKYGWGLTTKADQIFYFNYYQKYLYVLPMDKLYSYAFSNKYFANSNAYHEETNNSIEYQTLGYLIPISRLQNLIIREVSLSSYFRIKLSPDIIKTIKKNTKNQQALF